MAPQTFTALQDLRYFAAAILQGTDLDSLAALYRCSRRLSFPSTQDVNANDLGGLGSVLADGLAKNKLKRVLDTTDARLIYHTPTQLLTEAELTSARMQYNAEQSSADRSYFSEVLLGAAQRDNFVAVNIFLEHIRRKRSAVAQKAYIHSICVLAQNNATRSLISVYEDETNVTEPLIQLLKQNDLTAAKVLVTAASTLASDYMSSRMSATFRTVISTLVLQNVDIQILSRACEAYFALGKVSTEDIQETSAELRRSDVEEHSAAMRFLASVERFSVYTDTQAMTQFQQIVSNSGTFEIMQTEVFPLLDDVTIEELPKQQLKMSKSSRSSI